MRAPTAAARSGNGLHRPGPRLRRDSIEFDQEAWAVGAVGVRGEAGPRLPEERGVDPALDSRERSLSTEVQTHRRVTEDHRPKGPPPSGERRPEARVVPGGIGIHGRDGSILGALGIAAAAGAESQHGRFGLDDGDERGPLFGQGFEQSAIGVDGAVQRSVGDPQTPTSERRGSAERQSDRACAERPGAVPLRGVQARFDRRVRGKEVVGLESSESVGVEVLQPPEDWLPLAIPQLNDCRGRGAPQDRGHGRGQPQTLVPIAGPKAGHFLGTGRIEVDAVVVESLTPKSGAGQAQGDGCAHADREGKGLHESGAAVLRARKPIKGCDGAARRGPERRDALDPGRRSRWIARGWLWCSLTVLFGGCQGEADTAPTVTRDGPPQSSAVVAPGAPEGPPSRTRTAPTTAPRPWPSGLVADLHVDTITAQMERSLSWDDPRLESGLPAMAAGGVALVVEAAWIPRDVADPHAVALTKVRALRAQIDAAGPRVRLVGSADEAEGWIHSGGLAVILALEGGTALRNTEADLDAFWRLGVRVIGPTWTASSAYADSSAEPRKDGGLTAAGRELVRRCNSLGVMIDVSHMSDAATAGTLDASSAPVFASHSNARAVAPVPRNLPDTLLGRIGQGGGVVGLMFHAPFVKNTGTASATDVIRHGQHVRDVAGPGALALGSDWDGRIQTVPGLQSARDLPALLEAMRSAGWSDPEIDAFRMGNFFAFWRRVEAAASR